MCEKCMGIMDGELEKQNNKKIQLTVNGKNPMVIDKMTYFFIKSNLEKKMKLKVVEHEIINDASEYQLINLLVGNAA